MKRPSLDLEWLKIFILLALVLAFLAVALPARAQFGGVTTTTTTNFVVWTGITNAPLTFNGTPATNTWTLIPPSKYVVLTNVVNTNEVFIGSVYMQVPANLLTNFPGYSNLLYIGQIVQPFTNGLPAGGIWSTTTVPVAGSIAFPAILQAANGIYTNGIFCQ